MMKTPLKTFAAALLAAFALSGCGGYDSAVAPEDAPPAVPLPPEVLLPQPIEIPAPSTQ